MESSIDGSKAGQIRFKKINLEPSNKTLSDVLGNDKSYTVPLFQRDFSWEEPQLDELWQDIQQMIDSQLQHFMGYLVFQTADNKSFEVIDGQQRMTTISLLIIAALKRFKEMVNKGEDQEDNQKRIDTYDRNYLGVLNTVTLRRSAKLTLNRHNKDHFNNLMKKYQVPRERNMTGTNRKLNRAFEFFERKLRAYKTGEELARLITSVADGLMFTTITVQDDLNAYLVFETLNARGIYFSVPDLFKNYLLSTMDKPQPADEVFEEFEKQWFKVLDQLSVTDFTNFLRSHIGMTQTLPNKKDLYRVLKTTSRSFG